MLGPFQCILVCSRSHCNRPSILLAASGTSIFSFDFSDGALTSVWPFSQTNTTPSSFVTARIATQKEENSRSLERQPDKDRPSKRRRVSSPADGSDSTSAEILVEEADTIARTSKRTKASSITKLIATSDGQHVVAVTGEDKCIRVFELLADGALRQLSERYKAGNVVSGFANDKHRQMPKKPCALILTTDESTILCADKFGDVYSLPLLGHPFPGDGEVPDALRDSTEQNSKQPMKAFVPAATSLTVHTRRNQQALKNQQKVETKAVQKRILDFEHQLLLGHVSLLTDLIYVEFGSKDHPTAHPRSYILTSDRDEHIRVSRGLTQAHIIEGYCLGHTEFVSRLCVLSWNKSLLVSGGGDGILILWDWLNGTIKQISDLRHDVETSEVPHRTGLNGSGVAETDAKGNNANIAVSGIWALPYKDEGNVMTEKEIVVTCEGRVIPLLRIIAVY